MGILHSFLYNIIIWPGRSHSPYYLTFPSNRCGLSGIIASCRGRAEKRTDMYQESYEHTCGFLRTHSDSVASRHLFITSLVLSRQHTFLLPLLSWSLNLRHVSIMLAPLEMLSHCAVVMSRRKSSISSSALTCRSTRALGLFPWKPGGHCHHHHHHYHQRRRKPTKNVTLSATIMRNSKIGLFKYERLDLIFQPSISVTVWPRVNGSWVDMLTWQSLN